MEFTDILDEHHIHYHSTGKNTRPGWVNFRCPLCGKDPYMGFHRFGKYFHCWSCGGHSRHDVMRALNIRWCDCGDFLSSPAREDKIAKKEGGKLKIPWQVCFGTLLESHLQYLSQRLPHKEVKELVKHWRISGIGEVTDQPILRWRIFIPIYWQGGVASWTSRSIQEKCSARYYAAKDADSDIPIKNLLYGYDFVRNTVIVVEGPLDVWTIGPGAVAVMGLQMTPAKMQLLSRIPNRVICFDSERDAQRRARKLQNDLSIFAGRTSNIVLETGKDAAEADVKEIESVRAMFLSPRSQLY